MATTDGSLLTGSRLADWVHSPTGRMRMKRSGIRMSTTSHMKTEYMFDDKER